MCLFKGGVGLKPTSVGVGFRVRPRILVRMWAFHRNSLLQRTPFSGPDDRRKEGLGLRAGRQRESSPRPPRGRDDSCWRPARNLSPSFFRRLHRRRTEVSGCGPRTPPVSPDDRRKEGLGLRAGRQRESSRPRGYDATTHVGGRPAT